MNEAKYKKGIIQLNGLFMGYPILLLLLVGAVAFASLMIFAAHEIYGFDEGRPIVAMTVILLGIPLLLSPAALFLNS